uniref:IS30 family transposase n=2 Tax=Pyramidobacter sp. CG50-2 TaxID=2382160 RepID=UPI0031590A82
MSISYATIYRCISSGAFVCTYLKSVARTVIDMLKDLPHESVTSDRGCEFYNFEQIGTGLGGTKLYYPKPHQPWQRGTNENTNGLLRECFPKKKDVTDIPNEVIQMYVRRLNSRPRKCLHWKSPYEVFYSASLRLV